MDKDPDWWLNEELELIEPCQGLLENQAAGLYEKLEEPRKCRLQDVIKHTPDVKCLGHLVVKFSNPGDQKPKGFYGTASLIQRLGDEKSKKFMIITVAHNFIQIEEGEQLEFLDGVFVLQR